MGTDLLADLVLAATLIGVCVIFCGLMRNQRAELTDAIKELRTEIRRGEERLGRRMDDIRSELVETRVAMADRVARIEGRVFGVHGPGTGADSG